MKDLLEYLTYSKELTINPFGLARTSCNNNCEFCIVSERMQKEGISLDYFKTTIQYMLDWLIKYKDILPSDINLTFFLMAGEVYHMGDEYFQLYRDMISNLYKITNNKWKTIKFNLQSNLLHNNITQIIDLTEFIYKIFGNYPQFTTSFDLYGRFNTTEALQLWKTNLIKLSSILSNKIMVEMILTEPALTLYNTTQTDLTETLDYILANDDKFSVSFEDFILNDPKNANFYPKTETLLTFYTKIKEKYPTHSVLHPYLSPQILKIRNDIPRPECILIQFTPDVINDDYVYTDEDHRLITKNCLGGMLGNLSKHNKETVFKDIPKQPGLFCMNAKTEVNHYFNTKMGCAYCKYKPRCIHKCFAQHLPLAKTDICQTKALFKLFEDKN